MKPRPSLKKKTVRLQVNGEINCIVFGISSHENDYRLVWAINNALSMQFIRTDNLVVHNRKTDTECEFSRYIYYDEERYLKFTLISNRCPDGFLFGEIRNLDFLIGITGESEIKDVDRYLVVLKKVDIISAAFRLETKKLKDISQILSE
jgi:hypothetical protein